MAIAYDFLDASRKSYAMAICYLAAGKVNISRAWKLFRARKSLLTCKTFTFPAARKQRARSRTFHDASRKFTDLALCILAAGKVKTFHAAKLFRARKSLLTCETFTHSAGKVGVRAPWRFHDRDQEFARSSYTHFSSGMSADSTCPQTLLRVGKV